MASDEYSARRLANVPARPGFVPGSVNGMEPVYWESTGEAIVSSMQPGPPFKVAVTGAGIVLIPLGPRPDSCSCFNAPGGHLLRSSGAARWVGLRLIEAATIQELHLTGRLLGSSNGQEGMPKM